MKHLINLLILVFVIHSFGFAQELNTIVPGVTKNIPDGWHKFEYQGSRFDVEVIAEGLTQGNIIWFDQSRYSGSLSGNNITGKGTYIWKNRERYEGLFKNNMRHGKGTMFYKDGSRHYGKWKNNKKNGKGQEYDKDGNIVRDGTWENDVFVKAVKSKKKKNKKKS